MISNSSKYAIRAVVFLAIHTNEQHKMSAKYIAEKIDVPAPFLAKTLQLLTKKQLISSTKGPKGGFFLSQKDRHNTMLDIIYCIDGLDKFRTCFLGLSACSDDNPCPTHHLVAPFRQNFINEVGKKTVQTLAEETASGKTFIFLS